MPILGIIASSIQKAFSAFSDNFNRTTSGDLGTSSSGGLWEAIRGTWFANGVNAKTSDLASTYPISTITMASPDSNASFSVGSSPVVIAASGTVGTVKVGGTASGNNTIGTAGFFEATITGMSSTTGIAVGDWISATAGTGSIYGGLPDYVEVTEIVSSTSIKYRTKGGTTPVAGDVSNIATRSPDGGPGIAVWVTDSGNWFGVTYGRGIEASCNCSVCYGSACTAYQNNSYTQYSRTASSECNRWATGAPTYSVTNYQLGYGSTPTYGNLYSKTVNEYCNRWADTSTYSAGGTYSTTSCSTTTYSYSSCNCQTCYPPYISVIKSTGNAFSEAARWSISSMAATIKIVADSVAKTITIKPYKDSAMTTQIGTDIVHTASTATPTNKFGIVLAPSDRLQGNQVDNFNANKN